MRLLSLLGEEEFPVAEVVEMIKRLHVPGYEIARNFFRTAISEGVIDECAPGDFYKQSQIRAVLQWLDERRR